MSFDDYQQPKHILFNFNVCEPINVFIFHTYLMEYGWSRPSGDEHSIQQPVSYYFVSSYLAFFHSIDWWLLWIDYSMW